MTSPKLQFFAGEDPKVYNWLPEDPSGFSSTFRPEHIEALCHLAEEESQKVLESVPRDMHDLLPLDEKVPLYRMHGEHPQALASMKQADTLLRTTRGQDPKDVRLSLPHVPLAGLAVHCSRESLSQSNNIKLLRRVIGHEIIHVLTRKAVNPLQRVRVEQLTSQIEHEVYGPSDVDQWSNVDRHHWTLANMQSTDGLAEPDFAAVNYLDRTLDPVYIAAPLPFRGIQVDVMWKIWKRLLEGAQSSGNYPTNAKVESAVGETLGTQADPILRSPAFRVMQKDGAHVTVFQNEEKSLAMVFPTHRERNPHYGQRADGSWDLALLTVREMHNQFPFKQHFSAKQGGNIRNATANGMMGYGDQWSFQTIIDRLKNMGNTERQFVEQMGNRMTFTIPTLPPIDIFRKEGNTVLRLSPRDIEKIGKEIRRLEHRRKRNAFEEGQLKKLKQQLWENQASK